MRGTEVTISGICVRDDGGKVFGRLGGCSIEFDSVRPALLGICNILIFQSSTADAWYVRLL